METTMELYIRHYLPYDSEYAKEMKNKAIHYLGGDMYVFKLEDSFQYQAILTGDYSKYEEYTKVDTGHTLGGFMKLQEEFDVNKIDTINIAYENKINAYTIQDGCHRTAILMHKGIDIKDYLKVL